MLTSELDRSWRLGRSTGRGNHGGIGRVPVFLGVVFFFCSEKTRLFLPVVSFSCSLFGCVLLKRRWQRFFSHSREICFFLYSHHERESIYKLLQLTCSPGASAFSLRRGSSCC